MSARPDFAAHRARLLERLGPDEAVLLFGAPHHTRSNDTEHRFRQDSDLWWLTGWPDPECAVFLRPGEQPFTMFVQPKDPEREVWTGRRAGPEGARERYGADAAYPIGELEDRLTALLQGVSKLHFPIGRVPAHDSLVHSAIRRAERAARKNGLDVPDTFHQPAFLLHELRLHKGEDELAVMREATRITAAAHVLAMRQARPGVNEGAIEAAIDHHFRASGGSGPGYNTIVAGGDNANILHYITNDQPLRDGDLLLIDAGCEYQGYTGDVTRTFPVSGRFTPAQREVYEWVLAAQEAAFAEARVGRPYKAMHEAAARKLSEAMVALGLLEGDPEQIFLEERYKRYYMHGTGHWLGLDVHDAGAYARAGRSRPLTPGMIVTVEPGLYIPANDERAPERLRGIGVRIEDDVLITEHGPEILTAACPKSIDAVEEACAGAQAFAQT